MLNKTKILTFSLIILLPLFAKGEVDNESQQQKQVEIQLHFDSINKQYYTYLNMGKDYIQRNFKFLIDTGSRVTWVLQSDCTNCRDKNKNMITRGCESDTCQNRASQEGIQYGFGSVAKYQTFDYIRIDDIVNGQTIALQVEMGHVTELSKSLLDINFNGLIALSPNQKSLENPFIHSFRQENKIDSNVFSINFRKEDPSLILGGINQDLVPKDKQISYIPMDQEEEYWRVSLQDFKVGNKSILHENQTYSNFTLPLEEQNDKENQLESDYRAHIDSGSNYIVVEQEVNERLKEILQKDYNLECMLFKMNKTSQFRQIECNLPDGKIDKFPPLTLHFTDVNDQEVIYTIPPKQYIQYDMSKQRPVSFRIINEYTSKQKSPSKDDQGSDSNNSKLLVNEVILGFPFLQNKYVVFDQENSQIGMVQMDPYSIKETYISFSKYILVAILIMTLCFVAAQKIVKNLN